MKQEGELLGQTLPSTASLESSGIFFLLVLFLFKTRGSLPLTKIKYSENFGEKESKKKVIHNSFSLFHSYYPTRQGSHYGSLVYFLLDFFFFLPLQGHVDFKEKHPFFLPAFLPRAIKLEHLSC